MYYADRSTVTGRFKTATQLVGVPMVDAAYLTDDCSRIYVWGLSSVFYVQRE